MTLKKIDLKKVKVISMLAWLAAAFILGLNAQKGQAQSTSQTAYKTLVVEEIHLVDPQGRIRAKIVSSPGEEGVSLTLYHKDGRHATLYKLNPTGLPNINLIQLP